jgi:hypothetical protein
VAKGLKPGDPVSVIEPFRFKRNSAESKSGLKSVMPGEVGHVVEPGQGRSVVVEFKGVRGTIPSRRLQLAPETASRRARSKRIEQAKPQTTTSSSEAAKAPAHKAEVGSYDRRWMTALANKLLMTGNTKPDKEAAIEIRLADLPEDLQQQIQALVQAKLVLGLESEVQQAVEPSEADLMPPTSQSRGRKPKAAR